MPAPATKSARGIGGKHDRHFRTFVPLIRFEPWDRARSAARVSRSRHKKPHLQSCVSYLDQEPEYVLGGFVLAAAAHQVAFKATDEETDRLLQMFDEKYQEVCETKDEAKRRTLAAELDEINDKIDVSSGILWIPYGVRLEVTDGQHRIKAILNRIKDKCDPALTHPSQGIAAMVIIEQRCPKRQQDFVDLGQTAPIQPTIKIHMDYRQPVTKLVKDMVENVPIFAEQFIEFKRPSIRKGSINIYSLSNIKTAVQAMLLGNTRLGAAEAQRKLTQKLGGADYDQTRDRVVDFFSRLSQEVACFRQILDDPDSIDFEKHRDHYMCLNSVGLAVMGMVGHELVLGRAEMDKAVEAVAKIDWSRDNPLWEGTLRVGPGVARGGNVIELGGSIVKAVGGLPLTARDIERLRAVDGLAKKLPAGCLDAPTVGEPPPNGEQSQMGKAAPDAEQDEDGDTAERVLAGAKGGA